MKLRKQQRGVDLQEIVEEKIKLTQKDKQQDDSLLNKSGNPYGI
jgi:hypothetical protein